MTREQAIKLLLERPVRFAWMLGFDKLSSLHNEWIINMVRGTKDATLQGHRGSYKTTCLSIAISILMILMPNLRIMFMRKTDGDVKEVIKQVGNILKSNYAKAIVAVIYGVELRLVAESSGTITTNLVTDIRGTDQLVGIGTSSSITGKHFDRIFTDDIVNVRDRVSKAERDRTKIIYQELHNIKNRGGRIFNTGTPWHKDDCFSIMPEAKKYDCYSTGLMTEEEIQATKAQMLNSLFAANYELRHIASDDVIFTDPITGEDPTKVEQGNCHIDAAYEGEDYTAFTICRKSDGVYYVLGKLWRKHIDDVEDEIIALRKAYNCGKISCETNGDHGYLGKELRRKGERVELYHEDMNKYLKITSYLKSEWKNVRFVLGTDEEYINQICDYNENAEHDDAPDSLASVVRRLWSKRDSVSDYTPLMMRR